MKNKVKLTQIIAATASVMLLSCGKTNFTPEPNSSFDSPVLFENSYKMADSEIEYTQPNFAENKTTISFQAKNAIGDYIHNLLNTQLVITENGIPVTGFELKQNSTTHTATADILFVVDVTGSMSPTIEAAKRKLIDFVNNTRAQGYHTRMCLSTFGDYTVQYCNRFYDNDPKNAGTESQVTELISEITKLKALTGSADPGGRDLDENPMRAVIDAAHAPWGSNSQRFVILVTDAGFLYSPGNSGAMGPIAPLYTDVLAAISQANMKIFAVTPTKAGYDKKFNGLNGIVAHSGGEWYKFSDLVSGVITLNTVLDKILSSIDTTYIVDYVLTATGPLDPSKPLSERNIQISLADTTLGTLNGIAITSSLPNGRVADPKRYHISDRKIKPGSLKVYVNGILLSSGYNLISQKEVEFGVAQTPGASLKFKFEHESARDAISLTPIQISLSHDKFDRINFTINKIPVDQRYFELIPLGLNLSSIILTDDIFGQDDPFKINATGAMEILIKVK